MKFTATLNLNRDQLNNLSHFVELKISTRLGHQVTVELSGEKESIQRILSEFADPMQQKIFAAKAALEELVEEVQKYHGCKGHGTSKSVLIPLNLENDTTDHFALFSNSSVNGLQVSSCQYDWVDGIEADE